jgi:ApaG protein
MSDTTTRGIRIKVQAFYVPDRSAPAEDYYFFAYTVTISNGGDMPAQLVSREWVITDADGHIETVKGPGVIGQQPRLSPGESFEYTSFCPLTTTMGTMHGCYTMRMDDGNSFDAEIAPFTLAIPHVVN